jgi:transcription elongation factor Elf1
MVVGGSLIDYSCPYCKSAGPHPIYEGVTPETGVATCGDCGRAFQYAIIRCPRCKSAATGLVRSWYGSGGVYRRYNCGGCGLRFFTLEAFTGKAVDGDGDVS